MLYSNLTRLQITEALNPTTLDIHNDSHKHAHHKAMQGVTSREVASQSPSLPPTLPSANPKQTHFRYGFLDMSTSQHS